MATRKTTSSGRVTPPKSKGAVDQSPTSASSWKKQTVNGTLVTVPSGNTALIRTPGMQVFLEAGVIPNALLPLIQESMARGGPPTDDDLASMIGDPKKIKEIVDLANAVTVFVCIDPVVKAIPTKMVDGKPEVIPIGHSDRDADTLYVDEVDFNDKMYVMGVAVGGTAALEKFREEQGYDVEPVPGQ